MKERTRRTDWLGQVRLSRHGLVQPGGLGARHVGPGADRWAKGVFNRNQIKER
jgi:hypothetical protein